MVDRFFVWVGAGVVTAGISAATLAGAGVAIATEGASPDTGASTTSESPNSTDTKDDSDTAAPEPVIRRRTMRTPKAMPRMKAARMTNPAKLPTTTNRAPTRKLPMRPSTRTRTVASPARPLNPLKPTPRRAPEATVRTAQR